VIRYSLLCEHDHAFEAWFSSSDDYDDQAGRGLVECPYCAARTVRKAITAPAVQGTKKDAAAPAVQGTKKDAAAPAPSPEMQSMMMEAAAKVRAHVEENFDYVGDRFAKEARDIHEGVSEARGIYGEATPTEVKALREDGVPVAPLPPALAPKPKERMN
jgi:hypothetical protein